MVCTKSRASSRFSLDDQVWIRGWMSGKEPNDYGVPRHEVPKEDGKYWAQKFLWGEYRWLELFVVSVTWADGLSPCVVCDNGDIINAKDGVSRHYRFFPKPVAEPKLPE